MPSASFKNGSPTMEKYCVTLTAEERVGLERLVSTGRGAARQFCHARILLLAEERPGQCRPDEDIVAALGSSQRTIERVRRRFVTEGLEAALHPRSQPARPGKIKIKGEVEQKLLELACSDPPLGRCHWTLQMLADELVVLGLLDRVSVETVRQALKKTTSSRGSWRPGASHRWPTLTLSGAWRM
jgi:transposase